MPDAAPVVIYHRNCLDGLASAAVVQRHAGPCQLIAWTYGHQRPAKMIGRRVFIVDCCLPVQDMRDLRDEAQDLQWFDHHRTAVATRADLGWGVVDQEHCGASLTWRELFPDQDLPEILAYVRDKDLWRWELPDSRIICAGLESRLDEDTLDELWKWSLDELRAIGAPIRAEIDAEIKRITGRGVVSREPYGLRGRQALVLNNAHHLNEVGERAYLAPGKGGLGHDLAIQFSMRSDGKWVHSLRSQTVDCEAIASQRGGGGHPNAAAYITAEPFPQSIDCLDWPG